MTPPDTEFHQLGWDAFFATAFDLLPERDLVPARVGIEHNHLYRVRSAHGELLAKTAGKLRHEATGPEQLPAVGDWVGVRINADERKATIRAVLPRRSYFSRKAAGDYTKKQVVAANIDAVFLVSGLDHDFNLRRIERYLVAAAESGAQPILVLNKADLRNDVAACVDRVRPLAPEAPLHVTSCATGEGLDDIAQYLKVGQTVALLGSSGVGKSAIINRLLGHERQRTHEVRSRDSRGRHTTVHRELILVPGGGVIIDTPGMRELQIWDSNRALEEAFKDIETLAADCRFRDCRHRSEPQCAVQQAVNAGQLTASRLEHYHRLQDERAYLECRRAELAQIQEERQLKVPRRALKKRSKAGPR